MNSIRSTGLLISSAIFLFLSINHVSAETVNRVVACVNDDVITLYELNEKIKAMTGYPPEELRSINENKFLATRRKVLEFMIDQKITEDKIKELQIEITPRRIDAAIERIKKNNHWTHEDLLARLKKDGLSYEKYRDNIKRDLERFRLINYEVKSKIIIRDDQINRYYQQNKDKFSTEGIVHLAIIFLRFETPGDEKEVREIHKKGEDILARLRQGEDFGELARKYSQGPGAEEGGSLGKFKTDHLEPELKKILENIPEGGVSELIDRPDGVQIIKLVKKQEGKVKTLEEVRDAIYGILFKEEVNKRYSSWIKELREKSYTRIIF